MSRGTIVEYAGNGKPLRFIGVDVDITERKKNDKAAFQFELERQRIAVLSTFIQDAKHEFKTPLSGILTSAGLIERYNDIYLDKRISKHVGTVKNLVSQLL